MLVRIQSVLSPFDLFPLLRLHRNSLNATVEQRLPVGREDRTADTNSFNGTILRW